MRQTLSLAYLPSLLALLPCLLSPLHITAAADTIIANFTLYDGAGTDCTAPENTDIFNYGTYDTDLINTCFKNYAKPLPSTHIQIHNLAENCKLELYNSTTCLDTVTTWLGTFDTIEGCDDVPVDAAAAYGAGDVVLAWIIACPKS